MAVVTKTLKASGGDYSLMSTWESTEQTDLVADGDTHVLECYADWPSGLLESSGVTIAGWTTGASNTITVRAADGEGHGGVFNAGFWMYRTTGFGQPLTISANYVTIEGIELQNTATSAGRILSLTNGIDYLTLDKCLFKTAGTDNGVLLGNTFSDNLLVRNCLVEGTFSGAAFKWQGITTVQNCTAIVTPTGAGASIGFLRTSTSDATTIKNCVSIGADDDFDVAGNDSGAAVTASNNASGDTTAPGTSPVTGITSADFVDYAGGDYQPTSTGDLAGAGTDLSADFDDDITGTAR